MQRVENPTGGNQGRMPKPGSGCKATPATWNMAARRAVNPLPGSTARFERDRPQRCRRVSQAKAENNCHAPVRSNRLDLLDLISWQYPEKS